MEVGSEILSVCRGVPAVLLGDTTGSMTMEEAMARVRQSEPEEAEQICSCRQVLFDWADALTALLAHMNGDDIALAEDEDICRIADLIQSYFQLEPTPFTDEDLKKMWVGFCSPGDGKQYMVCYTTDASLVGNIIPSVPVVGFLEPDRVNDSEAGLPVAGGFMAYLVALAAKNAYYIDPNDCCLSRVEDASRMLDQYLIAQGEYPNTFRPLAFNLPLPYKEVFDMYLRKFVPEIRKDMKVRPVYGLCGSPHEFLKDMEKMMYEKEFTQSIVYKHLDPYNRLHADGFYSQFMEYVNDNPSTGSGQAQNDNVNDNKIPPECEQAVLNVLNFDLRKPNGEGLRARDLLKEAMAVIDTSSPVQLALLLMVARQTVVVKQSTQPTAFIRALVGIEALPVIKDEKEERKITIVMSKKIKGQRVGLKKIPALPDNYKDWPNRNDREIGEKLFKILNPAYRK